MAASNGFRRIFCGGSSGGSGGVVDVLMQNQRVPFSSQPLDAFFFSGSSSSFLGSSSMVSFEDVCGRKRSERSFFQTYDQDENGDGDDDYDDYFHQPEKKRRLTVEQVKFLEKSFEVENKLEPERKIQLAKELGLQPRQVAIWFQNRRARWKTKQLEKDYDILQASYDSLRDDYDTLLKEKEKLQAEVILLTDKLGLKEKEQGDDLEPSNIFNHPLKNDHPEPIIDSASESEDHIHHVSIFGYKHEDVLDSDSHSHSPHQHHVVDVEAGESSYAFDADHSDISQDDQDYLSRSLLPTSHIFTKIEDVDYQTSLFWPYWDVNLKM